MKKRKENIILAIDPGAHGAIAVRYQDGNVCVEPYEGETPAVELIENIDLLSQNEGVDVLAFLEKVGGFIGQGQPGSSMFRFGENYGFWRGLLLAHNFRLELITPQKWQKSVDNLGKTAGAERKRRLRDAASRLFPKIKCTLANSDALLILDYALKHLTD